MIGYYPINPAGSMTEEDAFGPRFFRMHFFDRMREVCVIDDQTPVLELVLTSGQVLDISHIVELKQDYMLASVFVDTRDCQNVYSAYIRYQTIYRLNVLTRPTDERPIGFNAKQLPAPEAASEIKPVRRKKK